MTLVRNLFAILLALAVTSVSAQSRTVTGKISAGDGSVLPGVSIVEKGTENGTTSNSDGVYTITVSENAILVFSFLGFKSIEVPLKETNTVDLILEGDANRHWPVLATGYGYTTLDMSTVATARLVDDDFNHGNIYDPAQSWQGKVAGLSIYNRGGNPNAESILRIRGMSSFDASASPLIVVDGVPMATLHNLDPLDIESITVLKDGASASIYGMRGSNGVIMIDTKQVFPGQGLSVTYRGEGAASALLKKQPVLNASESIAIGANNLGSDTDWQEEITRTGISSAHHLTISAASQYSSVRVATHLRNVEGILLNSGFNQANTRINVRHGVLNNRLRFDLNGAVTNRKIDYSFPEAFRYANTFLPTAPITFDNGDYYQAILFDNYNPMAMLKQNINRGKRRSINYDGKVAFNITDHLTATMQVAQQFESNFNGTYYSRNSFYIGQSRGGLAKRFTDDSSFSVAEGYLTYSRQYNTMGIDVTGGYSAQQNQYESFGAQLGNFPNDELGYNALGYSADILAGQPGLIDISSTSFPVSKIIAGFLRARVNVNEAVVLSISLRKERSNKLGENGKDGFFPSAAMNVNVLHYLPISSFSLLNARISYGITGNIPTQYGLAQNKFEYFQTNGGTVRKVRDANPDLTWEKKREINLGFDISIGRLTGSIDIYKRNISNLILEQFVDTQVYPSGRRFENAGGLEGKGFELMLQYYAGQWDGLTWNTSVVASTNKITLDQYPQEKALTGYLDSPNCGCSTQLLRLAVGEKFGQFWGPVFDGVAGNGAPIYKDINADGMIVTDWSQALTPTGDFTSLGSAMPSWEFGWSNQLTYRKWELNAFFRGATGHSLINALRLANEPIDLGAINTYNRVSTGKAVAGLAYGTYSSLYVEKANFLKLDNITLQYSLQLKPQMWVRSLRVFGTVQNAFVLTNYSGADPEPVLIDRFPTSPNNPPNALTPGIDRNASYSPARTFLLGIVAGM